MRPILRLLPLPLCIAATLSAQAQEGDMADDWGLCPVEDAVPAFAETQRLSLTPTAPTARAQQPTEVEGDTVTGAEGASTTFQGNVALTRGDQFLGSDQLSYNSETGKYVAEGHVRYQDSSMRMVAERAEGDQNTDTHKIDDLRYQLVSRRGNGGAQRIDLQGDQGVLHGSTYSTCPPSDKRWELKAQRIEVDNDTGMGVARNATLRIGKVPVLYVPWFPFPIDERRRTGLLFPSLSNSDRNGFDYKQPIYLNLAPNYDATLYPRIMTKRGAMFGAEFRYLTNRGSYLLSGNYMPDDDLRDRDRGFFTFRGVQPLNRNWQFRSNLIWISDPRYFEDFNGSLNGIAVYSADSDIGLYGQGRFWESSLSADYRMLADYTLTDANLPFHRMPRATFRWERPLRDWLVAGVESEAVRFEHKVYDGGARMDVKPYVSMPFEGASWFVRPTLAWRYTRYQLDDGLARQLATTQARTALGLPGNVAPPADAIARFYDDAPSRSVPIGSVDAGLFFDRETRLGDTPYVQTLEPRLFYLNVPYRDQSALPNFDTRPLTFSWGQLFRDNRFSSADRQGDANQLTLALTTRLVRGIDGREKLSASIGQIRYFEDSQVALEGELPIRSGKSAWVADANYAPTDQWTLGASYQWNPQSRREDLATLRARYLFGDDGIFNLAYRYRRNQGFQRTLPEGPGNRSALLEQADVSFLYPINPSWSIVGRYYYSILDHKALEQLAGVQWDSCCIAVRLVTRRWVHNREGDLSNGVMFEIELKGLGSAGQDTRKTLRRAIVGYNRDDLYLVPPEQPLSRPDTDPDPMP